MKRPVALHPVFFALAPILFVYAHNRARVPISASELLLPGVIALAASAVLWLLLGLALRDARRAALVVSLVVVLFFLYGHAANALGPKRIRGWELPALWLLLLAAGTWLAVRRRGSHAGITIFLNVTSAVLLAMNLLPLAAVRRGPAVPREMATRVQPARSAAGYPDIYYIILDAYARSDILKAKYGLDNSVFLDSLRARGFYVADRAQSNYAQTYLSLASSLNFEYLDSLALVLKPRSADHAPLIRMLGYSRVAEFLKTRGYKVVSFASGYTGTDIEDADVHLASRSSLTEFQNVLISTTLLPVILAPLTRQSEDEQHRERVRYTFRNIPRAGDGRQPVFVFAHIVSPHPPFVFGAHGEMPKIPPYLRIDQTGTMQTISKTEVRRWYRENYGPQVTHLNSLVESMVQEILVRSATPPIIILQGDHGPGSILNWDDPGREQLLERHSILYAVFTPQGAPWFYDSITPVNTFRILLSRFLDTTLALLPDRSYFSTLARPYELYDVRRPELYPIGADAESAGTDINVVAFPVARRAPANPATYCRRLVTLKYQRARKQVESFFVLPVPDRLTPEQAFKQYRELADSGRLPDLGQDFESYSGRGPEQDTVTALFFPRVQGVRDSGIHGNRPAP